MAMPLIHFTLVWLFGIWLASRLALPTIALGVATLVAVVGIILARRAPRPRWVFTLAFAAIVGALRINLAQPHFDQTTLATYNDQPKSVIVEGVAAAEPDVRDMYTNLRVEADQPTRTVKELVLVQAPPFTDFRYGDRVRAEGKLQTSTDTSDFSYRDYLARQGVYLIMSRLRVNRARFFIISPRQWREQHDSRRFMFIGSVIITERMAVCLRFSPLSVSLKIQTLYASQPMSLRLY